jgi:hypothetical protein
VLVAVLAWPTRLGGAFFGVVVALWGTPLTMHVRSLCHVQTSLSLRFVSGVRPGDLLSDPHVSGKRQ